MSAVRKTKMSVAEYLAADRRNDYKSEFFNGEMFAMAGGSIPHNAVKENLSIHVGSQLIGGTCRSFSSDQRVQVEPTGLYTYPDLVIVCGKIETAEEDADTVTNPRVLVEVLSPSTELYDRTTKFRHYQQIPSMREYVVVSQSEPLCERYSLLDSGEWTVTSFVGLEAVLELRSVPVRIPLSDLFAGVEFPPEPAPPTSK